MEVIWFGEQRGARTKWYWMGTTDLMSKNLPVLQVEFHMRIKSYFVGLLLIVASLSGCIASAPVIDADAVKDDGLLLGEVISNSRVYYTGDVKINGETFQKAINRAYIRLSLKPGTYELEEISTKFSTTSGNLVTTTTTRHPTKVKFTIKAGHVTNLGKVVFYFRNRAEKKYYTLFVDNREDMQAFLRREHPGAYVALRNKNFSKADVTYANKNQIKTLRTVMLAKYAKVTGQTQYIAGNLGSLAKVVRNKQGKIISLQFVETGTYRNIGPCVNENGRFACVVPHPTKGGQLYVAERRNLRARQLPAGAEDTKIKLIGKKDIVLVNNSMEVYTSMDNGRSWSTYTASRLEKPLEYAHYLDFTFGKKGYYLYSKGQDATILYRRFGTPSYELIAPPKEGKYLHGLTETDKGLYAGPEFTMLSDAKMFFKSNRENKWVRYKIPSANCHRFEVIDRNKDRIATKCSNKYFVTDNHGKTWRQALRSELKN